MDDERLWQAIGQGLFAGVIAAACTQWAWGLNLPILAFVYGIALSSLRSWPELAALLSMLGTTVLGSAIYDIVTWDGLGLFAKIGGTVVALVAFFGFLFAVGAQVTRRYVAAARHYAFDAERAQQWEEPWFARLRARRDRGAALLPLYVRLNAWVVISLVVVFFVDVRTVGGIATGVGFVGFVVGVRVVSYGQRLLQPSGTDALLAAGRAPVLFLRPFSLDALPVSAMGNSRFGLLSVLSWVDKRTFEEYLSATFADIGPVIAIGRPGEEIPELGAAREYASDETWRTLVLSQAAMAELVIMEIDRAPGMEWELENVTRLVGRQRVVIMLPPEDPLLETRPAAWYARWDELRRSERFTFLPAVDRDAAAVLFDQDDTAVVVPAGKSVRLTIGAVKQAWLDMPRDTSGNDTAAQADLGRALVLGMFQLLTGQFGQACGTLADVRGRALAQWGERHQLTMGAGAGLASALVADGRWDTARDLQEELLVVTRSVYGDEHSLVGLAMARLAHTLQHSGEFQAAEELGREAFAKLTDSLGPDDQRTLSVGCTLASALAGLGRAEAATALFADLAERARRVLGPEHTDTLLILSRMATQLAVDLHRPEDARPLQEEVLAGRRKVLGTAHPETLLAAANLAWTLNALGEHDAALKLIEPTYERQRRQLGEQHPSTLAARNCLAVIYADVGDLERAVALQERMVADSEQAAGERHPYTLAALTNLGRITYEMGDLTRSREALLKAHEGYAATVGHDNVTALNAAAWLVGTLDAEGDKRAAEIAAEMLPVARRTLGADGYLTELFEQHAES